MSDIVERLREYVEHDDGPVVLLGEAADEIERLRAIVAAFAKLVHYPEDLHPDSSTATPLYALTGKHLRRSVGWSYDEQEAWLSETFPEGSDQ